VYFRTAEPMTAQGTRKGEPSLSSMRNGLRPQPARLVRGSSRRIMSMRFRPANIRVINRRESSSLSSARLSEQVNAPRLTSRNVFPLCRPSKMFVNARTVLDGKGLLRRAKQRRALAVSAPFRPTGTCDGRLRREHFSTVEHTGKGKTGFPPNSEKNRSGFRN
jgi:hypothetical protein